MKREKELSRRTFLGAALAAAPLALTPPLGSLSAAGAAGESVEKRAFDRLHGPMCSITMAYNRDLSIDHGALRAWTDDMCEKQAPILFMTYGDSELYNVSEKEMEAVCRTVAGQARGRTLVCGGTPQAWTGQTIDFVNRLEDSGVNAVTVHTYDQDEEGVYRALSGVAEKTRLPLLAYEKKWSRDLVKRIAKIPRYIGMKCHAELYRYYDYIRDTRNDNFGVLSAGQMKHFLFGYLIGSPGYLCPISPFAPEIGLRFFHALQAGDVMTARKIVYEYEEPLLKITGPLGYPQAYKCGLYLLGLYKTNLMRPPKRSNPMSELEPLREFFLQKGILKKT